MLIFPGGISVIRHATHGVISASLDLTKENAATGHVLRAPIILFFLAFFPVHASAALTVDVRIVATLSLSLSVSILRELSHSSCAGPEKSNEALVGSTNVYRPRDPWRTRYVNLPGGARGIIHGIAQGGPARSSGSSMTYLLATTVTDESARIA